VDQVSNDLGSSRRVAAHGDGRAGERLDVLVHAAAQLSDAICVDIDAEGERAERLQVLARAYGIEERVWTGRLADPNGSVVLRPAPGAAPGPREALDPPLGWEFEDSVAAGVSQPATMAELVEALCEPGDPPASCRVDDGILGGQRIAVVTNLPTHYRVPLFDGAAKRVHAAGGELMVLFTSGESERGRPWLRHAEIEFDHRFLSSGGTRLGQKAPIDLGLELRRFRPTLIVAAGFSPGIAGRVAWFAARRGVPFGIWSGETHRQTTARSAVRWLERKWIADRASFAIAYGWLSLEYMRALAPRLPSVIGRNTAPFPKPGEERTDRLELEALAVAQAIPRKGLDVIVDAFGHLGAVPARLTIAGGGSALDDLIARANGSKRIRFLGPVNSDRVLECYSEADVFLFPSRSDVFGLALVEAMGSGLPTITAAAPGSVADLAVDGRNCSIVGSHDPRRWADGIRRLVADPALRDVLATSGRQTILRRWTIEHSVDAWIAGLRLGLLTRANSP
jgi:glycosyltransferase involved in cell wall biosynthesis